MTTDPKALIERLERKVQMLPPQGSVSLSIDGNFTSEIWDDGVRYVNPDGPAAAQALRDLTAENERLAWMLGEFAPLTNAALRAEVTRLKALGDGLAGATKNRQACEEKAGRLCPACAEDVDAALAAWEKKDD